MLPKQQAVKRQRVRMTNKTLESRQFSTVRLPRSNEALAQKVDVDAMHSELRQPATTASSSSMSQRRERATGDAAASSPAFDPIPNDPMLYVVDDSKYWPPPSLEELQRTSGVAVVGADGFDAYDRREDDKAARKQRGKVLKGELNHPRGKPRQNTVMKFANSSSENEASQSGDDGNDTD